MTFQEPLAREAGHHEVRVDVRVMTVPHDTPRRDGDIVDRAKVPVVLGDSADRVPQLGIGAIGLGAFRVQEHALQPIAPDATLLENGTRVRGELVRGMQHPP